MLRFSPAGSAAPGAPCTNVNNLSTPKHHHNSNRNAWIRLQTQHIDSAIQLLKMQYDVIMTSVENSGYTRQPRPSVITSRPESREFQEQMMFDAQFDLSSAVSVGEHEPASISCATASTHKRGSDSAPLKAIIAIIDQATENSSTSALIKSTTMQDLVPSSQPAKRPRLQ
jgi:hypothetical protein